MGDDSEWLKLPTEEKCQHKVWKARVAGYEEATKLFNGLDEKSQEFSKYAGLMKKFVTDSNAVAQEKGLDAVQAFVENAPTKICARTCDDVVTGVITKCLNASKQKTKEKGMEIIMLYIEAEKAESVQECLMTGMENKQPKVVVGSIQTITSALRDFGTKTIQVKPLLKLLPKLLEDRDKSVREETKNLVIELYRWIGAALKPQMTNFKPIQVQELEAEFEKLPPGKPQQSRFLRSQQDLKAKMEEQAANAGAGDGAGLEDGGEEEEAIDAYELMTPVDILASLPKNFYEQIEAKKWQERKEVLEAVQKLSENPRLENGDYSALVRALLKVIAKDTNVMLVALAGKTVAGIANGLRKKFQPYAVQSVSAILEKFKEKKVNVVSALREAIDASYQATNLESIMEDTIASLDNKNPSIKAETALFLSRCFAMCTLSSLPKKLLKAYIAPLLKTAQDTDPTVREASFTALGTAMKVVTEKHIGPFLVDVDNLKMQKIQECCEKAVLLNAKGEPRSGGGGAAAPAAAAPAPSAAPAKRPGTAPPRAGSDEPKPVKRPATAKPGGASKGKAKPKGGGKPGAKTEERMEPALSDEAVEEKAQEYLPGDTMTNLVSSNWKERLAAMENFVKVVSSTSRDDIPCQVCVRTISKKPGLKETNFQVLKLKLELIAHLTRNARFTKRSAEFCLYDIAEKLGDAKNGPAAKDAFTGMSEALGLDYVSIEVLSRVFELKNPKNQQEALNWLATAIQEFGLKVNMKGLLPIITNALANTNPGVRTSTITLLGVLYMYMGETLRVLFENEKPALLQQIDAEFEKSKGVSPPAPIRKMISEAGGGDDDDEEDEKGDDDDGEKPVQDLVPRNDISEKITDALLAELTDKNWKVRGEALQKVTTILSEAKFVTPNLGSLPEALKARLGESNKNLQMITIGICQTLATALGPHCKQHFKVIGPGLLSCLADSKPALREKVIACLNVWADNATLLPLVEVEAFPDALKVENPFLRAELLGWLTEKLPSHKQLPVELRACIPFVLAGLEDRNPDVRKKAGESLVPFMIHTGYDAFLKGLGKCKPSSKDQLQPLLEKARGELPAKPTKQKKAAPASQKSAPRSAPVARQPEPEDVDDEPEPPPPTKTAAKGKVVKGKGKPAPAPSSKKKEEEDFGPPMTMTVSKEQRVKEEKAMKILKWNFIELRGEYVEQLRNQMEKNFNKSIMADLFHNDFKNHIKAIEQLIKCLDTQKEETVNNLDLVLKWLTIRFFDTNPSMLNKALDYLQRLFSLLAQDGYHLSDLEATSFIPYLILKSGDPKDNVRRDVRNILKMMCRIYPSCKMFSFLIDGLKCKVAKQRAEMLDELGCLIENYGMNVCQPSPAHALKIIAVQIGDRDNAVRNSALNTIVIAYSIIGETVYKYIGNLKEKDQSLLDERIKRAMKNKEQRPPSKEPVAHAPPPQQQQQQRPKTAPVNALSKASSQPNMGGHSTVKKTYQLDVDIEDTNWDTDLPQLIELDLEAIMAPVHKPKLIARPASPASSKLLGSSDAKASVGNVVSQISAGNITTSIKALAQIDEVLKDERKQEVLCEHVNNILVAITMQCKLALNTYLLDVHTDTGDVKRLCRCMLSTLMAVFDKSSLAKKASSHILKDLITSLLTMILDSRVEQLDEGPDLIRSVNLTVVKIIRAADATSITCALIALMRECLQSDTCSGRFMDLVIKCLWKVLRELTQQGDMLKELFIDKVLYESHLFFQQFPPTSWKTRPKLDMPIRTIKTLLHNLTQFKGHKILSHTGLIAASENSEVEAYLHNVLAKSNFKNNEDGQMEKPKSASKPKRVSKTHELLTEIFKKIGNKENTREGLNDLFDFKKSHPDADIEPFLKKTSPHFQKYINNMLSEIEEERKGKKGTELSSSDSVSSASNKSSDQDLPGVDFYRERLRELRAKCGLDNNNAAQESPEISVIGSRNSSASIRSTVEDKEEPQDIAPPPAEPVEEPVRQPVDVSSLKARLERIKKMANS